MAESKKSKPSHIKWIACPTEEQYFTKTTRTHRQERKVAIASDRSHQKKTDRDQKQKKQTTVLSNSTAAAYKGRVIAIQSQGIVVDDGTKTVICSLRGLLKKDKWESKNFIAVGDIVHFNAEENQEGVIQSIEKRYSVLSRADNLSRRKAQLIACNIDQVLITLSVVNPELKPPLADRYILAATQGNMQPVIVINKIDLLLENSTYQQQYQEFVTAYTALDIVVIGVSIHRAETLLQLQQVMQNKSSVFSGQSGVGKSSLINAMTGSILRTGGMVDKTHKGSHTTTSTQMLPLPFGGWTIDTPGIRSFGLLELNKQEVQQYFIDIQRIGLACFYPDCTHINEPQCAVLIAVAEKKLSTIRLQSYYSLLESTECKHVRR